MDSLMVGSVPVFVVEKHHHVLRAWEMYRGSNVLSLDYHTDSQIAFQHSSFYSLRDSFKNVNVELCDEMRRQADSLINDYINNRINIDEIIERLKYDEHVDFAVRAGVVRRFCVVASSDGNTGANNKRVFDGKYQEKFEEHPIITYVPRCVPGCRKLVHDEDCRRKRADSVIESNFLDDAIKYLGKFDSGFFNSYLLDIDLDYFNTAEGTRPSDTTVFRGLVEGAKAITIAREDSCVTKFKLEGESIDSNFVLERVLGLISHLISPAIEKK